MLAVDLTVLTADKVTTKRELKVLPQKTFTRLLHVLGFLDFTFKTETKSLLS